ncbi:MAG TPA: diaminopimelate decarboxylase [Candidatus Agrococcus pullicola]|uniref:Diaminopimelate decarboxylase n=1 Tax=Candidatus Agrococcus pullicola TaxID=2838429 RepID=A0A9D1YY59_9MICO|nr:diaminopimelate decarboxylase [Candidatus Agrococcus pullicola]
MTTPLAPALLPTDDVNALHEGVWPARAERVDGVVQFAGKPVTELAAEYGTPLLLIDEQEVRERARTIRETFQRHLGDVHVYYAGKALLTADVATWMLDEGLRVDVCSLGEMALALAAGVPAEQMGLHGNNKSDAEIDRAVRERLGSIVLDSLEEIDRVARAAAAAGVQQAVRLRVAVGVHASTHDYLATAHEDQKFGVVPDDVPALVARIRSYDSLRLLGLHCHIGSQIASSGGHIESAARMLELHASLLADGDIPELNLGGGFGIRYVQSDDEIDLEAFASELNTAVDETCSRLGIARPVLCFEPGRSVVGPAGITLYEVGTIKPVLLEGGTRTYVSVDGGMSDNARPALYGAEYSARIVNRASEGDAMLARVVGMHCESGDIVVQHEWLPSDVRRGDLLAVAATGAYCHSLASNYNAKPRPGMVSVRDGEVRRIIRRETLDDVLARDLGLARRNTLEEAS